MPDDDLCQEAALEFYRPERAQLVTAQTTDTVLLDDDRFCRRNTVYRLDRTGFNAQQAVLAQFRLDPGFEPHKFPDGFDENTRHQTDVPVGRELEAGEVK